MLENLNLVTCTDYNVFRVRDLTFGNEMVVTVLHMLDVSSILTELNLNQELIFNFLKKI